MKKVLTILLALALVLSITGVVSAETTDVTYDVSEGYTADLPVSGVTLVSTGDGYASAPENTVGVRNAQIAENKVLSIRVDSENKFNVVATSGNTVSKVQYYAGIPGDDGGYSDISNGAEVLRIGIGDTYTTPMKFYTTTELTKQAKISKKHADTLTFTYEFIDEDTAVTNDVGLIDSTLVAGNDVILTGDVKFDASATTANSGYGATGVSVKGGVFDGNGNTFGVTNWGTWDCAVHTTGGTIKNLIINSGMRGIFMGSATADVYIENVVIDGPVYCFNSDGGSKDYGVYISDTTLNGWTSFSDVHKEVVFTDCTFGYGNGYAFCRPYNACEFINCEFGSGFTIGLVGQQATFKDCYLAGELITSENIGTLVTSNANLANIVNS